MCWGNNQQLQLGDGTMVSRYVPAPVSGFAGNAVAVSAGLLHACALTSAGGVKCWGRNVFGGLGDGTNTDRQTAVAVSGLDTGVRAISAGGNHTCALTDAGAVLCWGSNELGQLGDGTTDDRYTPTQVSGLESGVTAISTSDMGSCALTTLGAVFCWGWGVSVGDGIETHTARTVPTQVYGLTSGIKAIASGWYHSCAISLQGTVSCWGNNDFGTLGDESQTTRFTPVSVVGLTGAQVAIAAGESHTCSINTLGAAHCWGSNTSLQLGAGPDTYFGIQVPPVPVVHLPWRVKEIAGGQYHTCALTTGGVFCWGDNRDSAVGTNTPGWIFSPARVNGLYVPKTSWHPPPH